ncbi:hypothetical protein GCM10020221_20910 [Streptomyces thioluteus]|uniref:Uncharacterized protein n=1 Tax=Streptomyces thioluteus TaxID=66431 RepID=A0ABN3WSI2_STRTU
MSIRALNDRTRSPERFTDTVGILDSWADGVLCVTRRNGETRTDPRRTRWSRGKVVPMTPARRRGPAAGVRELQETASRGWPAPETGRLGGWTLRPPARLHRPRQLGPAAGLIPGLPLPPRWTVSPPGTR